MMSKTDIEEEVSSAMALLEDLSPKSSDSGLSEDTCWALFGGPCPEALRKKVRPKIDTYREVEEEEEEWHSAEMLPVDERKQSVDKKKSSSTVLSKTSVEKNEKRPSAELVNTDQKLSVSDHTDMVQKEESVMSRRSKTSVGKSSENTPIPSSQDKFEALQEVDEEASGKSLSKDESKRVIPKNSSKMLVSKTSLVPSVTAVLKESVSVDKSAAKETSRSSKEVDKRAIQSKSIEQQVSVDKSETKETSRSSKELDKTTLQTKSIEGEVSIKKSEAKETSRSSKELDKPTLQNKSIEEVSIEKTETKKSSKELDKIMSANTIFEAQKSPSSSESLLMSVKSFEIRSPQNEPQSSASRSEQLEVISIKSSTESKVKTLSEESLVVEPPSSDRQQQTVSPVTINASVITSKVSLPQSPKPPSEKSFSSVVTPPSLRFSTPSSSESSSRSKSCFCRCCVERQVQSSRGHASFKKRNCKCNCCLSNFKIKIYEGPEEDINRPTNYLKFVSFNEDEITYHNKRIQTSVLTLPNASTKPAAKVEPKKLKDCICGSGDYDQSTTSCSTKPISPRNDHDPSCSLVKSLTNILKKRSTVKEVVNKFESRNGRCCGPPKRPIRLIDPVYVPVKPQPPRNGICICCSKPKEEHRTCFKHNNMEQGGYRCCTWQ